MEQQVADYIASGMDPEEARRRVRLDFGGLEQIKDSCREERKTHYLEEFLRDLRYGARMLNKSRRIVAMSIFAIALGVGANITAYSIADAFLIHPLLLPDVDRLVQISVTERGQEQPWTGFAPADYLEWSAAGRSFESIAAWNAFTDNLAGGGDPEVVSGMYVSANFFRTMGVAPVIGSGMSEGEDSAAVIGYGLFVRRFAANPGVIGRTIQVHDKSYRVAGVMPKSFRYLPETDVWLPLVWTSQQRVDRTTGFFHVTAKVRAGVSVSQANAELASFSAQWASRFPESHRQRGARAVLLARRIRPGDDGGDAYIYMLWISAFLVLLVATANVANLQFARASLRAREMAVRTALGAGRWRLVRQLLTENGILGLLSCVAGAGLAAWTVQLLRAEFPPKIQRFLTGFDHFSVSPAVLAYGLGMAVLAGLAAGIFPALMASSVAPVEQLKEGDRAASAGHRRHRLRSAFVVIQVSLSVVLLTGATVVARSIASLAEPLPNTDPESALTLRMILRESEYPDAAKMRAFEQRAIGEFRAIPGMGQVALVSDLPYSGEGEGANFEIQGQVMSPLGAMLYSVSPDYFRSMRMPIVQGRGIEASDGADALPVAVVSETMARHFSGGNPLGRKIKLGFPYTSEPWLTIVGVAADLHTLPGDPPDLMLYRPFAQNPPRAFDMLLRPAVPGPAGALGQMAKTVLAKLREIDPLQPAYQVQTLQEVYDGQVSPLKGVVHLMNVMGGLALVLATMGVFGVVANTAVERQKEVAIRMTFGARMGSVVWMVLRQGMGLTLAGVMLGTAGAAAFARVLAASIAEIQAPGAGLYVEVAVFLAMVAIPACYFPARRAALADPAATLRGE